MSSQRVTDSVLLSTESVPLASAIARSLQRRGHQVTTSGHAEGVRALLAQRAFDCVVIDLDLPPMGGLNLLEDLRRQGHETPAVLLGRPARAVELANMLHLGITGLVLTPLECDRLEDAVVRAVSASRRSRLVSALRRQWRCCENLLEVGLDELAVAVEDACRTVDVALQPIVDARSGRHLAYESLARPRHPMLDNPLKLIQAAELLDQSTRLGRLLCERAAVAFEALAGDHLAFINCAVTDLLSWVGQPETPFTALRDGRVICGSRAVVLELTERDRLDDSPALRACVERLRAQGFRFAIDDLGAGYASLGSLLTLEPEYIKLDRALTEGLARSTMARGLVQRLVQESDRYGGTVIAEGVETAAERDVCLDLGICWQQGWFHGRPAPVGAWAQAAEADPNG